MTKKSNKYLSKDKPLLWLLIWTDHVSAAVPGWENLSDSTSRSLETVKTVGWVMSETKEQIVIIPILTGDGYAMGSMTIIKNCIKEAHLLDDPVGWDSDGLDLIDFGTVKKGL